MNAQQISWLPEEVRNHIAQLERDLDRVTAERDSQRADIERLVWNLGGCDTIASGWGKPGDYNEEMALPALDSVSRMASERDALRARVAELEEKAERYRLTTLRQDATIAELTTDGNAVTLAANLAAVSKRNADLVAALEKIAKSDPLANGRYAAHNAAQALARHHAKQEASK